MRMRGRVFVILAFVFGVTEGASTETVGRSLSDRSRTIEASGPGE